MGKLKKCIALAFKFNRNNKDGMKNGKMSTLISRKQFFDKTIIKGIKNLIRLIDVNFPSTNKSIVKFPPEFNNIAADFPPSLLKIEARNLGLNTDYNDYESLLRAVHEAMDKQHHLTEDG